MDYPSFKIKTRRKQQPLETVILDSEKFVETPHVSETKGLIGRRCMAELSGRGFWLNTKYDWVIVRDSLNKIVLVPLKKDEVLSTANW